MARATYTAREAAAILGVSDKLLYRMAHTRRIPCLRLGDRILFPKAAIDALLAPPPPTEMEKLRRALATRG